MWFVQYTNFERTFWRTIVTPPPPPPHTHTHVIMITSSNGNIFRVAGHLHGEFTGHRWIPRTKASDWRGALLFSLICAWMNGWVNNREAGDLRRHRAHYDVIVMDGACQHPECWCAGNWRHRAITAATRLIHLVIELRHSIWWHKLLYFVHLYPPEELQLGIISAWIFISVIHMNLTKLFS